MGGLMYCSRDVSTDQIAASCPECSHSSLLHPSVSNPTLPHCLICELVDTLSGALESIADVEAALSSVTSFPGDQISSMGYLVFEALEAQMGSIPGPVKEWMADVLDGSVEDPAASLRLWMQAILAHD